MDFLRVLFDDLVTTGALTRKISLHMKIFEFFPFPFFSAITS